MSKDDPYGVPCGYVPRVRAGTRFVAELPPGYDRRTCMALTDDNRVVVTHPELPALYLSPQGQWVDLYSGEVHPAQKS